MNSNLNYDFVSSFELKQSVSNESIDLETMVRCLNKVLSSQQLRHIINLGIECYCKEKNNFDIIKMIQNQFSSINPIKKSSSKSKNDNNTDSSHTGYYHYYCFETFDIQEIVCKIFQFLDFQSLINCRKVNIQWMKDSYQPLSIYHVNTNNLYGASALKDHYHNILTFKNAHCLEIHPWPPALKDYFQLLKTQFCKIDQLSIVSSPLELARQTNVELDHEEMSSQYVDMIGCILQNSKNGLQKLLIDQENSQTTLVGNVVNDLFNLKKEEKEESNIYLKNLQDLQLRDFTVIRFSLKFNFSNLRVLCLDRMCTELEFWQQLKDGFCGCSVNGINMTKLSFNSVYIRDPDKNSSKLNHQFINDIIPSFASAVSQIKTFECYNSEPPTDLYYSVFEYQQLSHTYSYWMAHLSSRNDKKLELMYIYLQLVDHFDHSMVARTMRLLDCSTAGDNHWLFCVVWHCNWLHRAKLTQTEELSGNFVAFRDLPRVILESDDNLFKFAELALKQFKPTHFEIVEDTLVATFDDEIASKDLKVLFYFLF